MNEELKVIISAEIDRLRDELKKGKEEVEKFGKKAKEEGSDTEEAFKKIGAAANKGVKVMVGAIAAGTAALLALGASTKEYRAEQAKLVSAFETAGASAETAKGTYNDLFRVLGDSGQATEAANHLAKLTTEEKALAEWTNICQGIYATFGDSLPIEGLTEAANETAKVGTVTGSLADALNWAGINEDAFNEKLAKCNTEAEREALIRDTLNGLYNDAAASYEKNAADVLAQNEAQNKLNDSTAKLGEVVAPVVTMFTNLAATVLEKLSPALEDFTNNHGKKLEELLVGLGETIGDVINFIVENIEVISIVAGVILAIVAAINLYNAAMAIYNIVMAPVTGVILAITVAIVALIAIITLIIVYWDELKAAAVACWEWIKDAWNKAAEWFNNTIVKPIANFFSGMWDGLKNGAKKAWEGVKNTFSTVADFFRNIFSKAWEGVKKVFSVGGKIFDGIKDGIVTAFKAVVNAIIRGINKVVALPFNGLNGILNTLQNISFLGISPFSWLSWRAPVPQIPELERGGILKKGQIGLLEGNGAEAVVPLDKSEPWLSKMAEMLGGKLGGGNRPIYLMLDKKVLAEGTVEGINDITRLTGNLPLIFA